MKTALSRIAMALLGLFTVGCAFTVDKTNVNYRFAAPLGSLQAGKATTAVEVLPVVDHREVTQPEFLFYKMNGYGQRTRGGYIAEEPVATIVGRALQEAFQLAGFPRQAEKTYQLQLTIEELDYSVNMGFWNGDVIGRMRGKVSLRDPATDEILVADAIDAKATLAKQVVLHPDELFRQTLNAFVIQTVNSEILRSRLK